MDLRLGSRWEVIDILSGRPWIFTVFNIEKDSLTIEYEISGWTKVLPIEAFTKWVDRGEIKFLDFGGNNPSCIHTYKKYVGFTDTYDYCEKCNEKRKYL